jgi:transcriptional regulator with XRE-family HTH domain
MSAPDHQLVALAFGAILRTARSDAGLTQEILAERAELDRTYPSLLERGLRTPTLGVVLRVGNALRIEPATLVNLTVARLREQGVIR